MVVPARSHVSVEARSTVHPIHLRAGEPEGDLGPIEVGREGALHLADGAIAGRLAVRVDRLHGANRLEDLELARQVEAAAHPLIEGILHSASRLEGLPPRYRLGGEVTFKGVTRACAGEVTLHTVDGEARLVGSATFDIRDFGMTPPRVLLARVEPEVVVAVDLVLVPAAG